MKLSKNADLDKYGYSSYGIRLHTRSQFSLPIVKCGKNVVVFKMDKSSSRYTDKKRYRSPW